VHLEFHTRLAKSTDLKIFASLRLFRPALPTAISFRRRSTNRSGSQVERGLGSSSPSFVVEMKSLFHAVIRVYTRKLRMHLMGEGRCSIFPTRRRRKPLVSVDRVGIRSTTYYAPVREKRGDEKAVENYGEIRYCTGAKCKWSTLPTTHWLPAKPRFHIAWKHGFAVGQAIGLDQSERCRLGRDVGGVRRSRV
jgi:hypothetical protein